MEIQKWQNGYAVTSGNLIVGLQQAASRRPQDVQNDNRIRQAEANLQAHINAQQALGQGADVHTVLRYLDHVQYMIGQQ